MRTEPTSGLRRHWHDALAIMALVALWLLFFWRLFTPVAADQASLTLGDFSGQFVAFGGYQYDRLSSGEIPLWNPYNNGGLPFVADTQAAVFYPPRLLTIALAHQFGGWSYHALELEMTAHVLLYSLLMYAFVRRLTSSRSKVAIPPSNNSGSPRPALSGGFAQGEGSGVRASSIFGAFIAALIAGYSGFTVGYPLLQLALLEAAVWLPLAALGIHEATRTRALRWPWLLVTGLALGLSWLAGHPQTSYFLTLLLVAYFAYRIYSQRAPWTRFVSGVAVFGIVSFGLAAIQLLPGFEYLAHTARAGMDYEAKSNGFPVQDVVQFLVPQIMSLYSPLFVGLTGLVLAALAVVRRLPQSAFWAVVAVFALLWSFGGNGPLYPLLYATLPGLQFFRGQERAAYLVMNSLAVLAGLGAASLASQSIGRGVRRGLALLAGGLLVFAAFTVAGWLGAPEAYATAIGPVVRSALVAGVLALLLTQFTRGLWVRWAIAALLVFELFSVSLDAPAIYDPIPPQEQVSMDAPPLLADVLSDPATPFRVDGFRGLTDNYGSLYGVMDMRGISPLFLAGPFSLIEPDKINPRAWELFAVRYVFTDWAELPVPSEIVASGSDRYGALNLHSLTDPRPFARMVYEVQLAPDEQAALALTRDPNVNARTIAVLERPPTVALPDAAPDNRAEVTAFAPESFTVEVDTPADGILTLAHPFYPGWQAALDGLPVETLRAYGALTAVEVPSGAHTLTLTYDPLSFRLGAVASAVTWLASVILIGMFWLRRGFAADSDKRVSS